MNYWQTMYEYLISQGFPKDLVMHQCISPADADQIVSIITRKVPRSILEVGTFIGLSTGVIALACADDATLVCVDPNLPVNVQSAKHGYYESRGSLTFVKDMLEFFKKTQRVVVLQGFFSCLPCEKFREQLVACGIDFETIGIVGNRIEDFAPYDLVFLDGDHYAEAVYRDLSLMSNYVSEDGIIVLHDLSGDWAKQVYAGVNRFLQSSEFSFVVRGNLGFIHKDSL